MISSRQSVVGGRWLSVDSRKSALASRWLLVMVLLLSSAVHRPPSASAGYTIVIRPQVSPQFVTVHGAEGPELRLNPGQPVSYPAGIGRFICRSAGFSPYSSADNHRQEVYEGGTATDSEVFSACPGLKTEIAAKIGDLRKQALDRAAISPGVLAVYDQNSAAASSSASTTTRINISAGDYLSGMGSEVGMTGDQFKAYIVAENIRVGTPGYWAERQYLWLTRIVIPGEQYVDELLSLPEQYRRYCGL